MVASQKVVMITGASSGLGHEMAMQLASRGYKVGLIARTESKLQTLARKIEAKQQKAAYFACDVSDAEAVAEGAKHIEKTLGPIDVLIANAGISIPMGTRKFDPSKVQKVFATNVFGVTNAVAAVLPGMLQRKSGQIAAISSLASYRGFPYMHIYSASKAAVNKHLQGLRTELKPHGIHVTTICPGFIKTPMTQDHEFKMPFLMDCDKACRLMIDAIEQRRAVLNFPWQTYLLVRMANLLPDFIVEALSPDQSKRSASEKLEPEHT